jgi:hypothetical protein
VSGAFQLHEEKAETLFLGGRYVGDLDADPVFRNMADGTFGLEWSDGILEPQRKHGSDVLGIARADKHTAEADDCDDSLELRATIHSMDAHDMSRRHQDALMTP